MAKSKKGMILITVAALTLILTILGFAVLSIANSEMLLARKEINKTKAFYLAEAGVGVLSAHLSSGNYANIGDTALGEGSYRVDFNAVAGEPCAIATATVGGAVERIQVTISFLAPPYECGMYAGGLNGGAWTLMLRGIGDPCAVFDSWGNEIGDCNGRDIINGNIFVDGNVAMYQQSSVNPAPYPNTYNLAGDVNATGSVGRYDSATIAGRTIQDSAEMSPPDLVGMNYAVNNTHNVSQIFQGQSLDYRGRLPSGHPLRDVFCKNPTYDRYTECSSTTGDDYFLEPSSGYIEGNWKTAETPMDVGADRVYYINGNLWVNSKSDTFGFDVHGQATIVVTGNVYICDNLKYADTNSVLGIVALGTYDSNGALKSGGDIIFGDPSYGTMYTFSSMMFAANNFLFNSKSLGTFPKEPESSFTLNGSMTALNKISIERDWYTNASGTRRPARYDPSTNLWYDSGTGVVLTAAQVDTIKHYRMVLNYDDRVRSQSTQPLGLPTGTGLIYCGLSEWKELP